MGEGKALNKAYAKALFVHLLGCVHNNTKGMNMYFVCK